MTERFDSDTKSPRTGPKVSAGVIAGLILGIALAALVIQNTDEVPIEWLFWEWELPLWLLLAITLASALVVGELLGAVLRRRRRKQA